MNIPDIVPILQTAIGPTILISGVGLLLLTMTNRLARTVDRARALGSRQGEARARSQGQLDILLRRAAIMKRAISFAAASALCSALLIVTLFLVALWGASLVWLIVALFIAAMAALIISLALFIRDVDLSLVALKMDLHP
jgi:hypothetical protein